MICASEDVGNADPMAIVVATNACMAIERIGMPEAQIILSQAAAYVASAPKSNASCTAIFEANDAVRATGSLPIPTHLQDAHYKGAAKLGRGTGYKYAHDYPNNYVEQQYLPYELNGKEFYRPSGNGYEVKIKEHMNRIKKEAEELDELIEADNIEENEALNDLALLDGEETEEPEVIEVSESKEDKDKDRQTANQIVALVKGSVAIDMHYLWEKVITYFVIKEDASHLNKLLKQLKTAIAWLRIPDDKDREERLKNDMKKMLDAAIIYAFAPFPTFLDKLEERIVDVDPSVVSQFRMANMTRHSRFGTSALNYTNLITNVNRNFYKKDKIQLGANDVKVNIFYWLSPRFVYYYELYMPVLLCSLNPEDGVLKLNEVNKKTHSLSLLTSLSKTLKIYRLFSRLITRQ